ncbi:ABC transporter ATP-binding protein [Thiohalocapsa marina]|uniref:ABC transporter ATP-binding protein n=1 Tax=Thiohalocapsa marina TaxID=424902 RepID=A0A5M8FU44_9GAMM|nr:ABC transporter ATP-binding protein [Thiohalocapsa marina]KAA6187303.1 ABC transporter ATP-binding protein [Thiohalocapsa marina]
MARIDLDGVSVTFPIYDSRRRSLKNRLIAAGTGGRIEYRTASETDIEALADVSFALADGARVGLVGHNGAGKSTLLRVLAGIYAPCSGTIHVQGHIAPLFDISLGIDPEASGYENILIRGLFLGLSRREVKAKTEEIAEFTELGSFLDLPVRTYSTGMQLRLAFAVATAIDPEILLIDEGIAAGDAAFLEKANARLRAFASKASIIVLASHANQLIREICDSAILLEQGRVLMRGPVEEVLAAYEARRSK